MARNVRIHTFGIGSSFDTHLVENLAKDGRGHCSKIEDLESGNLAAEVVTALGHASHPSLKGCSLTWMVGGTQETKDLGEVFYNELIRDYLIVRQQDLA